MNIIDFENVVHDSTAKLVEQGYQFQDKPSFYSVEFSKVLETGVYCLIGFDWFESFLTPYKFKILLIRRRLPDFPSDVSRYSPLYLDLRNLMLKLYKEDIFPSNQYAWQFTDESNLSEQVLHAQSLIVEYGIKWLEDPATNINWVGQGYKQKPSHSETD